LQNTVFVDGAALVLARAFLLALRFGYGAAEFLPSGP
jgi:hypothetical protein